MYQPLSYSVEAHFLEKSDTISTDNTTIDDKDEEHNEFYLKFL